MDKIEFRQDSITYYRVSYPWASYKLMDNVVTTLASTFQIGSSFFHLTRTTIKPGMSFKFSRIWPGTYELAALEHLENPHRLVMAEMLLPLQCLHFWLDLLHSCMQHWHPLILGNEFKIWPDQTLDCELAALERLENLHRLIMGEMLWPL